MKCTTYRKVHDLMVCFQWHTCVRHMHTHAREVSHRSLQLHHGLLQVLHIARHVVLGGLPPNGHS